MRFHPARLLYDMNSYEKAHKTIRTNGNGMVISMFKRLLEYVEIKTKITSIFPFFMTLAYLFAKGAPIFPLRTCIFFLAMFLFDLTATTINNYMDTKTNHQTLQFKRSTALMITLVLFFVSMALGLYLVSLTDIVVLGIGALCFLCGVLYSYGPIPISRQAYGEFFSGIFYGFCIPFLLIYMNSPKGSVLSYKISLETMSLSFSVLPMLSILLLSIIPIFLTANIMLANNICDVERDITVNRFTLPYYLKKKALYLFAGLYYVAFLSVPVMVIFHILSPISLLLFLVFPIVQKNIKQFWNMQEKDKTFILSIQNFILMMSADTILIFIGAFLPFLGGSR